jgi:hypothetical protein
MRRLAALLVFGTVGLVWVRPARAWDNFGHMLVAANAWDNLKPLGDCRVAIDAAYTTHSQEVSSARIALGGSGLANLLNSALK